jgi:hypothetical protein
VRSPLSTLHCGDNEPWTSPRCSLAVYRLSSLLLVIEAEDGRVVELSLKELKDGVHHSSHVAWKDLLEEYQLFTCRAMSREGSRHA